MLENFAYLNAAFNSFSIFCLAVSDSKGIPPPFSLIGDLTTINNCFAPDDVEEIFRRLSCETSEFAKKQLETLKAMSPLSMKITRYQVKNAAKLDIYECLNTDFRIACRILQRTEFFEGQYDSLEKNRH